MSQSTVTVITVALAILAATVVTGAAQTTPSAPSAPSTAESTTPDTMGAIELTRSAVQVKRQAIVSQAMDLEPQESEAFWPLYRDYRLDMAKVNDRMVKLIGTYLENYETLSDDMASRMLDERLGIEKARLDVKKKYVARFKKVLPSRKTARFFQVESKLDSMFDVELAEHIPLDR